VLAAIAIVKLTAGNGWTPPRHWRRRYIAILGLRLVKRSAAGLMDEEDPADRTLLHKILDSHVGPDAKEPRICSYHKLDIATADDINGLISISWSRRDGALRRAIG